MKKIKMFIRNLFFPELIGVEEIIECKDELIQSLENQLDLGDKINCINTEIIEIQKSIRSDYDD